MNNCEKCGHSDKILYMICLDCRWDNKNHRKATEDEVRAVLDKLENAVASLQVSLKLDVTRDRRGR